MRVFPAPVRHLLNLRAIAPATRSTDTAGASLLRRGRTGLCSLIRHRRQKSPTLVQDSSSSAKALDTVTFRLLYCFFAIDHGRRKILHFNVTTQPTADWVVQQLRESFPDSARQRYVILDRDAKFSREVLDFLDSSGIKPLRTSVRSPWQNGLAERWVGSARRDCFDHVIALDEAHVRRLASENMAYHHADRTHDGLNKDTPSGRAIERKPVGAALISLPRVGGLHPRYLWKTAA